MKLFITSTVAAVALSTLTTGQVPAEDSKKPEIIFSSLKCEHATPSARGDIEVRVYSGPREIFKTKRFLQKGELWKFSNRRQRLTNDVRVELWKINHGLFSKDDKVGSHVIKRAHKAGEFKVTFDFFDRGTLANAAAADYDLRFRVDR
jgi:hypothetical protein